MKKIILFLCAGLVLGSLNLHANSGDLDPNFGFGGQLVINCQLPNTNITICQSNSTLIDSDGKILVGGKATVPVQNNIRKHDIFLLMRFLSNGLPDVTFGVNGVVQNDFGETNSQKEIINIHLTADGKILAVGKKDNNYLISRYLTNGQLDNTFANNGFLIGPVLPGVFVFSPYSSFLKQDGKILMLGDITRPGRADPAIYQLNADGSPDASFGLKDNGVADNAFGIVGLRTISGDSFDLCKVTWGLKAFVACSTDSFYVSAFSLDTGLPDPDFNLGHRKIIVSYNGIVDSGEVKVVTVDNAGKILISLERTDKFGINHDMIYRLLTDGSLDASLHNNIFGNGSAELSLGVDLGQNIPTTLLTFVSGQIMLGGTRDVRAGKSFWVMRLNNNATPDNLFGPNGDGQVTLNLVGTDDEIGQLLFNNGKILAIGKVVNAAGKQVLAMAQFGSNNCGNGAIEDPETCDESNAVDGDGCSSQCLVENVVPNNNNNFLNPVCGDFRAEGGEGCDDGNVIDGDGCSSQCLVEAPVPHVFGAAFCSNAQLEGNEECDDGNNIDGDGCSGACKIENNLGANAGGNPVANPAANPNNGGGGGGCSLVGNDILKKNSGFYLYAIIPSLMVGFRLRRGQYF